MEKTEGVVIPSNASVKVTRMAGIVEIQYMKHRNAKAPAVKKMPAVKDSQGNIVRASYYLNSITGEIIEQRDESRAVKTNSMRQTFKKMRYYINNNFTGARNELFITLTYGKELGVRPKLSDSAEIQSSFQVFIKRLKRRYNGKVDRITKKQRDFSSIDHFYVVEPHADGHAHIHVLLRFNDLKQVFIPAKELELLWGRGFVKIQSLDNVDNVGAYVTAYLSDMPLEEAESSGVNGEIVEKKGKKYVKGARLHYYPANFNLYRKSSGIKMPESKMIKYSEAKKIVSSGKLTVSRDYFVESGDFSNEIKYEQYNLRKQ